MKIAVIYGTRKGASRDSAGIIAEKLRTDYGAEAALFDIKRMPPVADVLSGYDAFVVGSSIVAGRWVPRVRRFLNRPELRLKQVAIFVSAGGTLRPADEGSDTREHVRKVAYERYVEPLLKKSGLNPFATATFGGHMTYLRQSLFDNWHPEDASAFADVVGRSLFGPGHVAPGRLAR